MSFKTNDHDFEPYGTFYDEAIDIQNQNLTSYDITSTSKRVNQLLVLPCESYIECPQGTARILVSESPDDGALRTFPVRHFIKLSAGIHFNLIPLSGPVTWRLITSGIEPNIFNLSTPYTYQPVSAPLHVRRIIDCWFTQIDKASSVIKPASKSYELLYVYEGSMDITLSSGTYSMRTHDLILYKADNLSINIESACSYLTVIFDVNQRKTLHILEHLFHCTSEMQQILWKILIESFEDSYYTGTLLLCYLQEALLLLLQFYDTISRKTLITNSQSSRNNLLSEILTYMNTRIAEPATIEDICREFYISRSSLQALFKTHLNTSPKNYLMNIKLQKSKELLRKGEYTISEVAYMLGFSSIHYFSRLFKKYFNITPSAYLKKISENKNLTQNE